MKIIWQSYIRSLAGYFQSAKHCARSWVSTEPTPPPPANTRLCMREPLSLPGLQSPAQVLEPWEWWGGLDSKLTLLLFPSEAANNKSIWDINRTEMQEGNWGSPHLHHFSEGTPSVSSPASWYGFEVHWDWSSELLPHCFCTPSLISHQKDGVTKQGSSLATQPGISRS